MATTIRVQPSQADPRLKQLVYSKYREMLGSYNNKANDIIQQLPAYMVTEDRGFNVKNETYGPPPPPPPMAGNNMPARRLQTQLPEAPACVQNAMMTKDKKPFTYTPGGIDLSQIKSPRMAKRIAMNAHSEGVTNKPKVSPLAQQNNGVGNNGSYDQQQQAPRSPQAGGAPPPPPPPMMGAAAMGMPFQVLPPPTQLKTPVQTNGARKSPNCEPLPPGFRPEIKIPENPMANLRPSPRPNQKPDYWVEEYRKEKSKSPIPPEVDFAPQVYEQKQCSPVMYVQQSQSPIVLRDPSATMRQESIKLPSPPRQQMNRTPPVLVQSPVPPNLPPPITPIKTPVHSPQREENQPSFQQHEFKQHPQKNLGNLYIPPPPIVEQISKEAMQNQQTPPWMSSTPKQGKGELPEWAHKDDVDGLNEQQKLKFIQQQQQLFQQQQQQFYEQMIKQQQNMMSPQTGPRERVIPISFEQASTPTRTPATPGSAGFGPQPFYGNNQQQFNNVMSVQQPAYIAPRVDTNANQFVNQGYNNISFTQATPQSPRVYSPPGTRVIPIQIEGRSPSMERTVTIQSDPRSPQTPKSGFPNQSRSFRYLQQMTDTCGDDDKKCNNETVQLEREDPSVIQNPLFSRPLASDDLNQNQLKRMQLSENDRAFMGRVKNQVDGEVFLHMEEDPRYRGGAIPSKAFKYLQTITDGTPDSNQGNMNRPNQKFAQQKADFEQDDNNQYVPASEQQVREPNLYTGSAIPSRSFKILQAMTQPENAGPGLSDL